MGIEYQCGAPLSGVGPNFQYIIPGGTGVGRDSSKLIVDPGAHPPTTNATRPCGKTSPGGGLMEGESSPPLIARYSPRTSPHVGPPPLTLSIAWPELVAVSPVNWVTGDGGRAMILAVTTVL